MPRYWDEDSMRYIECEVVFSGRESIIDGAGWQSRESYLTRCANEFGPGSDQVSFPSTKELTGKGAAIGLSMQPSKPRKCHCGRVCTSKRTLCRRCAKASRLAAQRNAERVA